MLSAIISFFTQTGGWTPGAVGIWVALILGVGWFVAHLITERRLNRKLSIEDREAKRNGFTAQLTQYQSTIRELMGELSDLRREYDEYRISCRRETDGLRRDVLRLEDEVAGWKRRFDTLAGYIARKFGDIPLELIEHHASFIEPRPES